MLSRRTILGGLAASAAAPSVALADSNMLVTYNRISLPCYYSKELAQDLWDIHEVDIKSLISHIYGTTFNISKTVVESNPIEVLNKPIGFKQISLKFELATNDNRDQYIYWYSITDRGI